MTGNHLTDHPYDQTRLPLGGCVTLIGMAGVGKSTVGTLLATAMDWALLDTDKLMEAYFGAGLQAISDAMGKEAFILAEERLVSNLGARRAIIATGGSVVYGPAAVKRLRGLGPLIFLRADCHVVLDRMSSNMQRGLAIAPGQTIEDLFEERRLLYEEAADLVVDTDHLAPDQCVERILGWLRGES